MSESWTLRIDDEWIAWLVLDAPGGSVNTFTAAAMTELDRHLDALAVDERIKAVAIRSGKAGSFIVGADINELATIADADDAAAKAETGHRVFAKIAGLPVPTVAVIDGACLGGGLEMALACDYRLVTDSSRTSLGLPEVKLGIIPGWGGTQRLPALVGLPAALTMILTGRTANASRALRTGLADGIVAAPFLEAHTRTFVDRVLRRRGRRDVLHRRRKRQAVLPRILERSRAGRWVILRKARRGVLAKTKGAYPAPLAAIEVLRRTAGRELTQGLAVERDAFARLACSPISRHLVWLFQANQRLKKAPEDTPPRPVRDAGVVGAGIMGSGIAWAFSRAGCTVRMKDINWPAVAAGMASVARMHRELVRRRKMTESEMNLAMHRVSGTVDCSGFADLDTVVEAVAEDLAIKKRVLREIEEHVGPDTLICTNTSSLPLGELAAGLRNPRRFVGLHFFNPVNRMPLVEVVACRKTSRAAMARAVDLVRRLDKLPVVVGDCPGFLVNRILLPYLVESAWMFEEGVDPERLDRVLERFGMPMGPLALVDEVGIDVGYKVAKVLEEAYGSRMHVASVLARVAAHTEIKGRKSGQGFYLYRNGHRRPNPAVTRLTKGARERDGVRPSELTDEEIVDRAVLIMVNEAARCLEERVVYGPEQLDMAMVMGTGFAPFRGGLLHYADERGLDAVRDRLNELADRFGDRFRPVRLINRIAGNGNRFYAVEER